MRALVKMSLFSTTLRRIVERMLELPVRLAGARLPTSLVRGALSGIYAIEYHRGLSDEMGTIGYRDLIEHRTAGGNA